MPSYTESSSIFGSIMMQPHVLGGALVEQRQHHRVDGDRLARAGGAGDQQVRHLARDPRTPARRRCPCPAPASAARPTSSYAFDLMISPSVTISRFSFGISRPITDLPGITSTTRTLIADSDAREVLGEAGDLADLHARRGPHLEARDHRARLHRDDLDLDAEILELEFDQARHRLERLRRIARLALRRIVEQIAAAAARRIFGASNSGTCRSFSTRSLFSTTGAGASMRGLTRAWPCVRSSTLRLRRAPSWLRRRPRHRARRCGAPRSSAMPFQQSGADPIDDREPGHAEGERHAGHPAPRA